MSYREVNVKGGARSSRELLVNAAARTERRIRERDLSHRPLSIVSGIQPEFFYGEKGEDVEKFIRSVKEAAMYNGDTEEHEVDRAVLLGGLCSTRIPM